MTAETQTTVELDSVYTNDRDDKIIVRVIGLRPGKTRNVVVEINDDGDIRTELWMDSMLEDMQKVSGPRRGE